MPTNSVRPSKALHDSAMLRNYVNRHSGFVMLLALGFAIGTCVGLLALLAMITNLGGDDAIAPSLGIGAWLLFNIWAIRAATDFLRHRAIRERPQTNFK